MLSHLRCLRLAIISAKTQRVRIWAKFFLLLYESISFFNKACVDVHHSEWEYHSRLNKEPLLLSAVCLLCLFPVTIDQAAALPRGLTARRRHRPAVVPVINP